MQHWWQFVGCLCTQHMLIYQLIFAMSLSTLVTLKDSQLDIIMVTDVCLQVIVYNSLSLYKTRINCNAEHN